MSDLFNEPLTDDERAELHAMPTHELYLLTQMVPPATVRGREVNEIYHAALDQAIAAGRGV